MSPSCSNRVSRCQELICWWKIYKMQAVSFSCACMWGWDPHCCIEFLATSILGPTPCCFQSQQIHRRCLNERFFGGAIEWQTIALTSHPSNDKERWMILLITVWTTNVGLSTRVLQANSWWITFVHEERVAVPLAAIYGIRNNDLKIGQILLFNFTNYRVK